MNDDSSTAREETSLPAATREGLLLASYLLGGREPTPATIDRYSRACAVLFQDPPPRPEIGVNLFVLRYPWTLPLLDAALGWLEPHGRLRSKLVLMLALLETQTEYTDLFVPEPRTRVSALARILWTAGVGIVRAGAGLLIYPLARRTV